MNRRIARGGVTSLALVALVFLSVLAAGCHRKVVVMPAVPDLHRQIPPQPVSVALYIDPLVSGYDHWEKAKIDEFGVWTMKVEFDVGSSLSKVIENTARTHFRDVTEVQEELCPDGADGLMSVVFAKQPSISAKWEEGLWTVGGNTTAEIACQVTGLTCSGKPVWRKVVVGYGSESHKRWFNWPGRDDFQYGIDAAVADFAKNLDEALNTVAFEKSGSTSKAGENHED